MPIRFGQMAPAEHLQPPGLLKYVVRTERVGLNSALVSDHLQPLTMSRDFTFVRPKECEPPAY